MSLQDYIVDTRDLIRDTQGLFVTPNQLVRYINEARVETAIQGSCIQRLITGQPPFGASAQPGQAVAGGAMPGSNPQSTFGTFPNQERYPYVSYGNQYLNLQHRGLRGICDVVEVSASWGGAFRPALTWKPWETFQAECRSSQILVTNWPYVWSVFNDGEDGEVWCFPPPQSAAEWEWIVFATPAAIYTDNDFDAIPHPWKKCCKYYAAYRAYQSSQRFMNAQLMLQDFNRSLIDARGGADRGKIPNYYPTAL